MLGKRIINTKVAGGGGCTDIVDNYDPFGGGFALYQLNGNANDVSGNYNGTATNVTYGAGQFGQAGVFNGSSSGIDLNHSTNYSNFTVSAWIKPNTHSSASTIIGKWYDGVNRSFKVGYETDNRVRVLLSPDGTAVTSSLLSSPLTVGSWYHIAVTVVENGNVVLYVNNSATTLAYNNVIFDNNQDWKIGIGHSTIEYFNGSIDQVRIFNTALTPLEVEALYTEELCICDGTVDTLDILGDGSCIATYQLDGNANDLSGNYSGTPTDVSYGVGEFDLAGVFSSSRIQLPTGASSFNNKSFSLWFKYDYNSQDSFSFMFGDDTTNNVSPYNGIQIWSNYSNNNNLTVRTKGGNELNILQPQNRWYHLCVTYDRVSAKIYIDGSYVNQISDTTDLSSVDAISMGANPYADQQYYVGEIDQVRIFNKALNSSEVTTLYNETACTKAACTGTTNTLDILGDGSCVATYPLDGSPADLSGNYNGVQTDVTYPQGEFDLAGAFSSGSFIDLGSNFSLFNSTQNLSMSLWFNTNSSGRIFGSEYNLSYFPIEINSNTDGTVYLAIRNSGGTPKITSSTTFNNGSWHHLVGIVNVSSNLLSLYINNTLIGTTSVGGSGSSNQKRFIGGEGGSFNGSIDQVRVFNKALSAGEVTTLYNETPCN